MAANQPRVDGPRGRAREHGAWPFVTLRAIRRHGRDLIWRARDHRKGLSPADRGAHQAQPLWRRRWFNWLIGLLFALGSALFALGCVLALLPQPLTSMTVNNLVFFAGSIPFTIAGYLQHFQSANAGDFDSGEARPTVRVALIGWRPRAPGWISTFSQFLGTIAFNFNTGDAIDAPAGWLAQDLSIWAPGFVGSVLFLISGYLAFIEVAHRYWRWAPTDPQWRLVFVNLAGCVFFMISSTLAYVPAGPEPAWIGWSANVWLLLGSLCFFIGAVMTMQEAERAPD